MDAKLAAPGILIYLNERTDLVMVHTYSSDGRPHTNVPPQAIKPENLPVLLYQLVMEGYQIRLYPERTDMIACLKETFEDSAEHPDGLP